MDSSTSAVRDNLCPMSNNWYANDSDATGSRSPSGVVMLSEVHVRIPNREGARE